MSRPIALILALTLLLPGCGSRSMAPIVPKVSKTAVAKAVPRNPILPAMGGGSATSVVGSAGFLTQLGATQPAFSPRGDRLAFRVAGRGIYLSGPSGESPQPLAGTLADDRDPAFNEGGDALAFIRAVGGGQTALMRFDMAVGRADALLQSGPQLSHPAWLPGGRALLYVAEGTPVSSLLRYDVATRQATSICQGKRLGKPTPTVDGRFAILEAQPAAGGMGLARVLLTGGQVEPLRVDGPNPHQPTISPSGRSLAYVADDGLYIANVDGTNARRMRTARGLESPAWNPRGAELVVTSPVGGRPDLERVTLPPP